MIEHISGKIKRCMDCGETFHMAEKHICGAIIEAAPKVEKKESKPKATRKPRAKKSV